MAVLDLRIEPDRVQQGSRWLPGVSSPGEAEDIDIHVICGLIDDGGFDLDTDDIPVGANGELFAGEDNLIATWTTERVPKDTPKLDIDGSECSWPSL